jgi:hypothetical protein
VNGQALSLLTMIARARARAVERDENRLPIDSARARNSYVNISGYEALMEGRIL